MQERATVSLGTSHFRQANEMVRAAFEESDRVEVLDANAQRYLGCGMPSGTELSIHGVPGNDLGCFLNGGRIEVFGNAQDQAGNTMNDGEIVVHGRVGDATGYAMRGGSVFVREGCGWRCGINMKEFRDRRPAIVIGGDAGDFVGEYMAGGTIVVMGSVGPHVGSGMHGGRIFLREPLAADRIPSGLVQERPDEAEAADLQSLLDRFHGFFSEDGAEGPGDCSAEDFVVLRPLSARPYAAMYC